MMPPIDLTDQQLWRTPQALLSYRIATALVQDTQILPLLNRYSEKLTVVLGQPPVDRQPPAPALFIWFNATDMQVRADGSVQDDTLYGNIKWVLKNTEGPRPIQFTPTTGTFIDKLPILLKDHSVNLEQYFFEARTRYVLEVSGFDNNWYYNFVENGLLGYPEKTRFVYQSYMDGNQKILHHLTCSFKLNIWSDSTEQLSDGTVTVTVLDGGAASAGATVYILDHYGQYVEDSSGVTQWTANGSGVATISGVVSQKGVTVYASKSTKSGTTSDDLVKGGSSITVNIS